MKEQVIYKIINLVNDKFYVGSTYNKSERFRTHRNKLRRNAHHCAHLQAAWNKYGEEKFLFKVIEIIPDDQSLQDAEDVWLIEHVGKKHCYNAGLRSGAPWRGGRKEDHPSYGKPLSQETKNLVSIGLKETYAGNPENHPRYGKKHSQETIDKIKANRIAPSGENHHLFGKSLSEEARRKISEAQKGVKRGPRILSDEGREKIRIAAELGHYSHWQGRNHTQESIDKMSLPIQEVTQNIFFTSLTNALEYYDFPMPTLTRALKKGKPIVKGEKRGLQFVYIDRELLAQQENINPNLKGERYVGIPVPHYDHCIADGCDRKVAGNGLCLMHYKRAKIKRTK